MKARLGQGLAQEPVQIGAVRGHVGRAVFRLCHGLQGLAKPQGGIVPLQRDHIDGFEGVPAQRLLEAQGPVHLHRVGPDLQTGADLFELGRALVDRDLEAAPIERAGTREPADARPDDDDSHGSTHALSVTHCGEVSVSISARKVRWLASATRAGCMSLLAAA